MRVLLLYNQVGAAADEAERDVLVQAEAVDQALRQLAHEPIRLECTLRLDELHERLSALRPDVVFNLVESLAGSDWLAHTVTSLLDVLQIPYTGSRTEALMISNDKLLAKRVLRLAGLPTPDWVEMEEGVGVFPPHPNPLPPGQRGKDWIPACAGMTPETGEDTAPPHPAEPDGSATLSRQEERGEGPPHPNPLPPGGRREVAPQLAEPGGSASLSRQGEGGNYWIPACAGMTPEAGEGVYLIKAVREHASAWLDEKAVVRVGRSEELQTALAEAAHRMGRPVFAERFIEGREFNLSVLAGPNGPEVLPPAEIDFSAFPPGKVRIVDYVAKWQEESFEYRHTPRRFDFPASDAGLLERLRELALTCWDLLGLGGYARVDFRVDSAGRPWILEINTNPCLSPDAGFAAAVERAGLSYAEAIRRILQDAVKPSSHSRPAPCEMPISAAAVQADGLGSLPPGCQFRDQPRPEDRLAVREIVRSTGFFNPAEIDVADELVRECLRAGTASGYYFLFLEHQGELIGYCCYGPIAATAGSFDLYWIVVHRHWQGQGFGRMIMNECESRIRQAGGRRIYIETSGRAQYEPTRRFYERSGYRCEARLPDFYAPGDDKLIYVKILREDENLGNTLA